MMTLMTIFTDLHDDDDVNNNLDNDNIDEDDDIYYDNVMVHEKFENNYDDE